MKTLAEVRQPHKKKLQRANDAAANGDFETAAGIWRNYLKSVPDDPKILFNLGTLAQAGLRNTDDPKAVHAICVTAMGFYADAISSPYEDPETKSDALNNHGLIMGKLGYPDKAKIAFHLALQLNPDSRAARLNFADILVFESEYDEADRQFFEIINSDPCGAGAQFSRSMLMLLTGDIRRGFRDYRARFNVKSCKSKIMDTKKPLWNGEDMNGKTLIITQEQGWGDCIQFIRYADVIKTRWPESRVIFAITEGMHLLFKGALGVDGLLPDHTTPEFKAACPEFDYHAPIMHLPDILGTTLETIPNKTPYILPHADWLPLPLDPTDKARRIGLCWAGSPIHGKDKWRSMKPEQFQRFIDAAPDAQFYSLQCGPRAHETEQLTNCVNLPKLIKDWTHTANAILQLDLVITVDTAIAHIAGALGVPCWILLPHSPDWRWMLTRTDSPWYPRAKLFRQPAKDDWEPVVAEVCKALNP